MSKHGDIRYFSKSRNDFVVIDEMPTPHLSRAAKKLAHEVIATGAPYPDECGTSTEVLDAMIDELASRVPPKDGVAS